MARIWLDDWKILPRVKMPNVKGKKPKEMKMEGVF